MLDNPFEPTELWYRANPKNVVFFAATWFGEGLLSLMFVKWVIHGSAAVYWLLVPWALFGLLMVLRPNWILKVTSVSNKMLEQAGESFEKKPPPGFP